MIFSTKNDIISMKDVTSLNDIVLLLMKLGITANYNGYWYLITILEMLSGENLQSLRVTKDIYPYAAQVHHTSPWNVDRGIRTVVDACWNRGNREFLCKICASSERPSNFTFIAALVTYLQYQRNRADLSDAADG